MAFGARPFGTRTFGDAAPTDPVAFVLPEGEILLAEIHYTTDGEGTAALARRLTAEVHYTTDSEGDVELSTVSSARINYITISDGSITIPPIEGPFRVELVGADATPLASIENAAVAGVVSRLNNWETWSFTLPLSDSKAHFLLEERIREAQIWKGDILLSWGPMNRPQVANGLITVQGAGASWHLSRRHVGKANRENLLCNPGFEEGLKCWSFSKSAFFLDFQQLSPGQVRVYSPGRDGSNALEINMRLAPYTPPSGSTSGGTINPAYTVVTGDTLWDLAQTFYGDPTKWPIIYEANKAQIQADAIAAGLWNPKDPGHWIFPGQVFTIPGLSGAYVSPAPTPADDGSRWGEVDAAQEFVISGGERGSTLTLTGFVKIPSQYLTGWSTHGGLLLARMPLDYKTNNYWTQNGLPNSWGGRRAFYTDFIEASASRMTEGHPLDGWIRHETSITVPPGRTEIVHARLTGVEGKTYWDKCTLTQDTAFEQFDTDQVIIVRELVEHAQDPAFDKNDVNISTETPLTGVKRDLVALHSEHANIWDLITEQTQFESGFDVGMRYTPSDRVLTTHYPFKGRTRTSLHLRLGRNIASYDWVFDGEAAASSTIVLGSGSGSDREEAVTIVEDAFADGLILETVTALGPEVSVDRLQEIADEYAAVNKNPEALTLTTYPHNPANPERRFIGYVTVGDLVPVTIMDGPIYDDAEQLTGWHFVVNDLYRVVEITYNPDDSLALFLNRRDFGNA